MYGPERFDYSIGIFSKLMEGLLGLFLFILSVDGIHGTKFQGIDQQIFDYPTNFFSKYYGFRTIFIGYNISILS